MRLSTKGRYAVTAMMDLAIYGSAGPVTLADISQCQDISLSYLEQLFAKLRKAKLVEGVRGPGGGYRLGRQASKISVAEIISAVDEKLDMTQCHGEGNCMDGEKVEMHFRNTNTTINDASTSGSVHLAGGANFTGSTNDTLVIQWDRATSRWYEISRSVN